MLCSCNAGATGSHWSVQHPCEEYRNHSILQHNTTKMSEAAMSTSAINNSKDEATRGRPYYEKLRSDLRTIIDKKLKNDRHLVSEIIRVLNISSRACFFYKMLSIPGMTTSSSLVECSRLTSFARLLWKPRSHKQRKSIWRPRQQLATSSRASTTTLRLPRLPLPARRGLVLPHGGKAESRTRIAYSARARSRGHCPCVQKEASHSQERY